MLLEILPSVVEQNFCGILAFMVHLQMQKVIRTYSSRCLEQIFDHWKFD